MDQVLVELGLLMLYQSNTGWTNQAQVELTQYRANQINKLTANKYRLNVSYTDQTHQIQAESIQYRSNQTETGQIEHIQVKYTKYSK